MGILYTDKPVFGFDIGRSSIKVMQIDTSSSKPRVTAYGPTSFDPKAIKSGVIVDHETVVRAAHTLLNDKLIGSLSTVRAAVSLPNSHSFSRILTLPKMDENDLANAVRLEVDQSIPHPIDELYYDYSIVTENKESGEREIQVVATPCDIVDSYMQLFEALGLEVALIEPNISAVTRIVVSAEDHDAASLIVDIGSTACDLTVFDGSAVRVTGTIDSSSERITDNIAEKLGVERGKAQNIKTRYGLDVSKKQTEIIEAAKPELNKLVNEIRKVMRYFADKGRNGDGKPIGQIIILGGGANLPGLSSYLTDRTRVPTRLCAPWNNISFGKLQPPHELESTLYTTASGLGLVTTKEISE